MNTNNTMPNAEIEEALLEQFNVEKGPLTTGFKKGYCLGLRLPWEVFRLLADQNEPMDEDVRYGLREMALSMKQNPKEFGGIKK